MPVECVQKEIPCDIINKSILNWDMQKLTFLKHKKAFNCPSMSNKRLPRNMNGWIFCIT